MNQDVICGDIPMIRKAHWLNELKSKNVKLCDLNNNFDSDNESIDMLIGADIAGKLFTGNKFDLSNGLTVLESNGYCNM